MDYFVKNVSEMLNPFRCKLNVKCPDRKFGASIKDSRLLDTWVIRFLKIGYCYAIHKNTSMLPSVCHFP